MNKLLEYLNYCNINDERVTEKEVIYEINKANILGNSLRIIDRYGTKYISSLPNEFNDDQFKVISLAEKMKCFTEDDVMESENKWSKDYIRMICVCFYIL